MEITDQNRLLLLARSRFRSRFRLDSKDRVYVREIGWEKLRSHAEDFILKRLAPAEPAKDGRQTPFRGHPVFKAQHATATCCRGCLEKWYAIPPKRPLKRDEIEKIINVIMTWIRNRFDNPKGDS